MIAPIGHREAARRMVIAPDDAVPATVREDVLLLVTELVTNSVKHARADSVVLRVLVGRKAVWTEVADEGPGFDPADAQSADQQRPGWGLFLVERLADRWGVKHAGRSTKVWFELRRG